MIRDYAGIRIVTSPLMPLSTAYMLGDDGSVVAINMSKRKRWWWFR